MNTTKDGSGENPDDAHHQKEWLDLSLGPYFGGSSCSPSRPTKSMKGYTCSFCGRKFYSPQALGGHQNGHRRERDAIRKYRDFQIFNQSIDVHSNRLVGIQARDGETNVARFSDIYGAKPFVEAESEDMKWSGSFYLDALQASRHSDPDSLDLNLRL